jgi:hypothetical protein
VIEPISSTSWDKFAGVFVDVSDLKNRRNAASGRRNGSVAGSSRSANPSFHSTRTRASIMSLPTTDVRLTTLAGELGVVLD